MAEKPIISKPNFRSEDFISLYANHVGFDLTGWDIALLFGDVVKTETESEVEVRVEQHTSVRLSWPQAKVAALLFAVNVAAQEEKNGPIKIPPNVIPGIVHDDEITLPLEELAKRIMRRAEEAAAEQAAEKV